MNSILTLENTHCNIIVASKKRALEEVARIMASADHLLDAAHIYQSLVAREKLGTTAIGHQIAIPHCRLDACRKVTGALFTLKTAIDFEAFDNESVKILFVLLVPTHEVEEHLQVLAMLASRFEQQDYRNSLCAATSDKELFERAASELSPG